MFGNVRRVPRVPEKNRVTPWTSSVDQPAQRKNIEEIGLHLCRNPGRNAMLSKNLDLDTIYSNRINGIKSKRSFIYGHHGGR